MQQPFYVPERVLIVLGRLASEQYQLRWIVNGTVDKHVLPSELLNDVEAVSRCAAAANTAPHVLALIHRLLAVYYESLESLPQEIDVQQNRSWLELRLAAQQTLQGLGHQIPDHLDD